MNDIERFDVLEIRFSHVLILDEYYIVLMISFMIGFMARLGDVGGRLANFGLLKFGQIST